VTKHTPPKRFSRKAILGACVSLVLVVGISAALHAQSGRSYGPDRIWWNAGSGDILPWQEEYDNADGQVGVLNAKGIVRTKGHPFFEALGDNGRACITCHQPSNAMSVSPVAVLQRWRATAGQDAVFEAVDGANCPDLPEMEQSSHSLLLKRGLFRIALPWPPRNPDGAPITPEFRIEVVSDPTGCNLSAVYGLKSAKPAVSVFRRPRVSANLKYLVSPAASSLMADGRFPSLEAQAVNAALVHEQATRPSPEQLRQIVDFELQLYTAQTSDIRGGLLGEKGGPSALGLEHVASGQAGALAGAVSGVAGITSAFPDFSGWRKPPGAADLGLQREFRASVARGNEVFFAREFQVHDSFPLNPTAKGKPIAVTCATCHTAGLTRWMDIGTANRAAAHADPDLPLFKITCEASAPAHPFLGRVIYTNDPGRALITGKCADTGSIVMQQFRGLAARAPYFANGSAASLRDLVDFYDRRFAARFSEQEKQDLVNFLKVL
jgi:hypothetical protein